jgi:hypothetical protein
VLQQGVSKHLQLGGLVQLEQLGCNRSAGMHLARLELQDACARAGGAAFSNVV